MNPLLVLVLAGVAERWGCPSEASPLAGAETPALDRLAREGRVFGVRLLAGPEEVSTAAPLLRLLGIDAAAVERARASYLGVLLGERLVPEECFLSADFLTLFRDEVADVEPSPLRPAEVHRLIEDAARALERAGFRLRAVEGAHHLALAPRASVDPRVPPAEQLLGERLPDHTPRAPQHALAHRLARETLDGHEINEVRRDLGENGADTLWLWGPGGEARLEPPFPEGGAAALGSDPVWRGVVRAAGLPLRAPGARTPAQLVRGAAQALDREGLVFLHLRRGTLDAATREPALRLAGLEDLDRELVGPLEETVAERQGRILALPDVARDTASGRPLPDPVPALLWGAGIEALRARPFHEAAAAEAGDPLEPGHGLLAYIRHL